ncbi:MAG: F0F1 ATP synthase subunit B [Chloroflexi bacterium]|nr:F0F1 ATP synthase subunit B [Chloroflexota bacterium]
MGKNKAFLLLIVMAILAFAVTPAFAAEEGGDPLGALGINGGFLVAQWVNFGLIFVLLTVLLWRPIMNHLDARSAKIKQGIEDAAAAANARRNAEAEAEKILTQAQKEVSLKVGEGQSRAEEVAKQVEAEARKEAEKILADARVAATAARDAELAGLRGQVTAIAVAISQRLIGETIDEKRQKKLVSEFLTSVPADAKNLSGNVEVISAMPLEDAEQTSVKKAIGSSTVTFNVDPAILGGLVIRAGGRVIDGSVKNNLNAMASRLN